MTCDDDKTELKKYFEKHQLRVKLAADYVGITTNQLYLILQGKCRPGHKTAKKLQAFIGNALTIDQIRPELTRPKCNICGRLLKKHHILVLRAKSNKEMKKQKEVVPEKVVQKRVRKSPKGLLSL